MTAVDLPGIPTRRRGGGGGETKMVPEATPASYYGHPVIKPPVWKPEVPLYLFTGGLAGGSALLTVGARLTGNDVLARRALLTGLVAVNVSPLLLVKDLGRPERFLNMLRVFKVTSPMSVGSWLLIGSGVMTSAAAASEVLGILRPLGRIAEVAAAALGAPLATYTGVLLTNTAVPAWHEARLELPSVFGASALTSAAAAAAALTPSEHAEPARRLAIAGAIVELAGSQVVTRRLGMVGEAYREGPAHRLLQTAEVLTATGICLLAAGRRRRPLAVAGGAALLAGALCERWGIFGAGRTSAEDPRYTVVPQRERAGRRP